LIFPEANIEEAASSAIRKLDEISRAQHSYETTVTLSPACYPEIGSEFESDGYIREPEHSTHLLRTEVGYDQIWKAYKKRVRGAVRKARKLGVAVRETEGEAEMQAFYKLYLSAMEHFGSTPKPYQLLRYLQTSSIARLVIAQMDDQIIGGVLFIHFNSSVRMWCGASDPNFLSYRPNNAIIDYIVQWTCENDYPYVDFGATPPEREELVEFKEGWRAERASFYTFTKLHSSRKKKLWTLSEPTLRRVYATIQRIRIRNI
jgi:lipid II:glycine glycyltransferase (peptidoglycan interpeptide bridge formation enzyme)